MVVNLFSCNAHIYELLGNSWLSFLNCHSVELFRIHKDAALAKVVILLESMSTYVNIAFLIIDDLNKWKLMNFCILEVSLVVCRNRHNSTCSVACKYEITDEKRYLFTIYRVDSVNTLKWASRLSLVKVCTIKVVLFKCLVDICLYFLRVLNTVHKSLNDISIWSKNHEGNTINCLDTGCKDGELTTAYDFKIHFNTCGLTDPVPLNLLGRLWPVNFI